MRIAFFGQSGPYAPVALRRLLADTSRRFSLALVVEGRKLPVGRAMHRWLRADPRGTVPVTESLGDTARAAGADVLQTCDVNAAFVADKVAECRVDALVCVGFDRLFRGTLLETAGVRINSHPSRLPELRGPSPLFWLLRHGVRESALTLHGIDAREDHGPIYAQEPFVLPPRATGEALYGVAGELAGRMLVAALGRAAVGGLVGVPQDEGRASRAPRPKPEDARVEPLAWTCAHLLDFACGAPYFHTPWLPLGPDIFHVRRGLRAEPGIRIPAEYVLQGSTLVVQCKDGLAHLEIQT
ncbi:MAG TPA: formyltransferase family protein [Myxococcota bacterium]|nr:formyltransferase family protein [Myxococcota bacterium]